MPFSLYKYKEVKDRYCIAYYGDQEAFVRQLLLVRPLIEESFPGIEIHIACADSVFHLLQNEPNTTSRSQWLNNRRNYAYTREIAYNCVTNPVEDLLIESGISPPKTWLQA
jgi:hypothetical protein